MSLCKAAVVLIGALATIGGATPSIARSPEEARGCLFENARYVAVEGDPESGVATLAFAPFEDGMTALSATLVTPEGRKLDVAFTISNGYVQTYASIPFGDEEIESSVQAFSGDMERMSIASDNPAPTYILMPQAGFEADFKQSRSGRVTFTIPDGAWKFDHCRQ